MPTKPAKKIEKPEAPVAATEKVEIKHWLDGRVLFTAEVEAGLSDSVRLGMAVKIAVGSGADLSGADLSGANLSGAYLSGAYLSGAYLSGADLSGANLSGANLSGANLSGAYLSGADLSGAYLSGANLSGANLSGANLSGADLSGAYLSGADLSGAYLSGANLSGANLSGANLSGAYLSGADLSGADHILDCGSPHGWRIVVVKHDGGIRIAAGCRWFTFEAAVEHWRAHPDDRRLMMPLLAYIKAAVEIKGWVL